MTRRISADPRGLILPRHPHMLAVANWLTSSSKHEQTKAELRRMPAEAVRNTQPAVEHGPKRSPKAKKRARLERFPAKWIPVRVKKTRQIKNQSLRSDSIGTEMALARAAYIVRLWRETATAWRGSRARHPTLRHAQGVGHLDKHCQGRIDDLPRPRSPQRPDEPAIP